VLQQRIPGAKSKVISNNVSDKVTVTEESEPCYPLPPRTPRISLPTGLTRLGRTRQRNRRRPVMLSESLNLLKI
jgi:hypothetical protein